MSQGERKGAGRSLPASPRLRRTHTVATATRAAVLNGRAPRVKIAVGNRSYDLAGASAGFVEKWGGGGARIEESVVESEPRWGRGCLGGGGFAVRGEDRGRKSRCRQVLWRVRHVVFATTLGQVGLSSE